MDSESSQKGGTIVLDIVGADPPGPENVVVFAPGIIAGTTLPNSGRLWDVPGDDLDKMFS